MFAILTAAADTSGHAMSIITFFVVSNPDIYRTLTAELKAALPGRTANLDYLTLEKLPYLTAVIKEGLRFSYGVPGRLPRVIETPKATFNGHTVPRGTIVGMSSWMMHRNPIIWPEPDTFSPERWLDPDKARKLEKYLVAFTKGSRQCIGMQYVPNPLLYFPQVEQNPQKYIFCSEIKSQICQLQPKSGVWLAPSLAHLELYVVVGTVFRNFENLRIFETTPADLEVDDYFAPFPLKDAKLIKVFGAWREVSASYGKVIHSQLPAFG
jgi:hypothetical protein